MSLEFIMGMGNGTISSISVIWEKNDATFFLTVFNTHCLKTLRKTILGLSQSPVRTDH